MFLLSLQSQARSVVFHCHRIDGPNNAFNRRNLNVSCHSCCIRISNMENAGTDGFDLGNWSDSSGDRDIIHKIAADLVTQHSNMYQPFKQALACCLHQSKVSLEDSSFRLSGFQDKRMKVAAFYRI